MSHYFLAFDPEVVEHCTKLIDELAPAMWHEAHADFGSVRIAAGNYAGYGSYVGRCYKSGLIELPTGNRSSRLKIRNGQVNYGDGSEQTRHWLWGTLLHELGHHVVNYAKVKPWAQLKAGYSTHQTPAWCWIAATGWKYMHPKWEGSPEVLAALVRHKLPDDENATSIGSILAHFSPYKKPPEIPADLLIPDRLDCVLCGRTLVAKRSDARYCSPKCRKQAWKLREQIAA
ncbi:hypothetical protein ACFL07_01240 [Pseudomonadota bacterium]